MIRSAQQSPRPEGLPLIDVGPRLDAARAQLVDRGLDALVLTHGPNIRWLTGFSGSAGAVLLTVDELHLLTDGRYEAQATVEAARVNAPLRLTVTRDILPEVNLGRVGFEANQLPVASYDRLQSRVSGELIDASGLVEVLRQTKDEAEIVRLERAAAIADEAFMAVWPLLAEGGVSENDVAAELEYRMRRGGADGLSFETIVASGPNGALPHARPSARQLEPGNLVVMDFGASVDGYGSDMTRTVAVGGAVDAKSQWLHDSVRRAQAAGVAVVADGVPYGAINDTCRAVLAEDDLERAFTHGVGHGIGLEIHELPLRSSAQDCILRQDFVVTVEPGAYLAGFGGVRVEDSVVVERDGCRILTHSPRDLVPYS